MGIKGLTKLIHQCAENSFKEGQMKSYFGRIIALDATMALYQFLVQSCIKSIIYHSFIHSLIYSICRLRLDSVIKVI